MKVHKKDEYFATKIVVPRPLWEEFDDVCKKHKTTTCQVIKALVEATLAGENAGLVTIPSTNPIMVQVNHVVLGAPRGRYSHIKAEELGRAIATANIGPVGCPWIGGIKEGQVLCRNRGSVWIDSSECVSCSSNWIAFP